MSPNGTSRRDTSATTHAVLRFLDLLQAGDVDTASDLLAPDVRYTNVSLPTIRGREAVHRVLRTALDLPGAGFEADVHSIAAAGNTVLTERVDVLRCGPVRIRFWVCGRFDVVDGRVVLWRDYFDWWNFVTATLRGLLGGIRGSTRPCRRSRGRRP